MANAQWEYRHVERSEPTHLEAALNALGADGWEAVGYATYGAVHHCVVLKRRLSENDVSRRGAGDSDDRDNGSSTRH